MPDVESVRRVARAKLGVISRGSTGELGMLARLLDPDEPILAMAIAKVGGLPVPVAARVVVATPRRMLFVSKGMITRREQVREIALASVRGARPMPPDKLELTLDAEVLRLSYVVPTAQLSALADAARGRSDTARFAELDGLARRKLGRFAGLVVQGALVALAEEIAPDEAVVDLAFCVGKPGGIVAVCDRRLVAIPDKGLGSGPPISAGFTEIVEVRADGADLVVRTGHAEHRFEDLAPIDRASVIAARVDAQIR